MKYLLSFFILLVLSGSSYASVFAHVLEIDNSVGAVMHIDPEDDPIVGEPTTFYFEFKDTTGVFQAKECGCELIIKNDQKEIIATLSESRLIGNNSRGFSYTFPQKGIYYLALKGPTFALNYDIRVERTLNSGSVSEDSFLKQHAVHLLIFGLGFGIALLFIFLDKGDKKT